MQTKVSMVIPCYNKVKYIDKMLESVYMQEWDNIEVILVNDGSTDGTRKKISEWKLKLLSRGYEVAIIDQTNQGVGSAVKSGLSQVTGDYICLPDCDDEISPFYVRHMAEILDDYSEIEWVWCNVGEDSVLKKIRRKDKLLLLLLLHKYTMWSVCTKMYRKSYFIKCKVIEKFVESRLTQEPQIFIPLAAGESWPYLLPEYLYFYNKTTSSIMDNARDNYSSITSFWKSYYELELEVLKIFSLSNEEHLKAVEISFLENMWHSFRRLEKRKWAELTCKLNNLSVDKQENPLSEILSDISYELIFDINVEKPKYIADAFYSAHRIICCCCLGTYGKKILPQFLAIGITPDICWDSNAENTIIRNIPYDVMIPDYSVLTDDDLVLILSILDDNITSIKSKIKGKTKVITVSELESFLKWGYYNTFKNMEKL